MRSLSIAAAALVAAVFCSPLPASAGACLRDEYSRVPCGAAPYQGRQYHDEFYRDAYRGPYRDPYPGPYVDPYPGPYLGPAWPVAYMSCPPGTVAGNYQCVPWRLTRGAKCPLPNMWVVDGFCRPYSAR
jgi:hypothetical protein